MRVPRFKFWTLMLAVATFAGWFALLHAYPAESMFDFTCGVPIFMLMLLEMRLDDGHDRERSDVYRACLWIGLSGITALAVHLTAGGGQCLP